MKTEDIIFHTAISDGMPEGLARFIVAQSKHETGNYSHRFFTDNNNAFGYSYTGSKWQVSGGDIADNGQKIAVYSSIENSVHELTDWIKRRQKEGKFPKDLEEIYSITDYSQLLKNSGYFTDSLTNYVKGLTYYNNLLPAKFGFNGLGLLVFFILISLSVVMLVNG